MLGSLIMGWREGAGIGDMEKGDVFSPKMSSVERPWRGRGDFLEEDKQSSVAAVREKMVKCPLLVYLCLSSGDLFIFMVRVSPFYSYFGYP